VSATNVAYMTSVDWRAVELPGIEPGSPDPEIGLLRA
jgi:hypothetical protein